MILIEIEIQMYHIFKNLIMTNRNTLNSIPANFYLKQFFKKIFIFFTIIKIMGGITKSEIFKIVPIIFE